MSSCKVSLGLRKRTSFRDGLVMGVVDEMEASDNIIEEVESGSDVFVDCEDGAASVVAAGKSVSNEGGGVSVTAVCSSSVSTSCFKRDEVFSSLSEGEVFGNVNRADYGQVVVSGSTFWGSGVSKISGASSYTKFTSTNQSVITSASSCVTSCGVSGVSCVTTTTKIAGSRSSPNIDRDSFSGDSGHKKQWPPGSPSCAALPRTPDSVRKWSAHKSNLPQVPHAKLKKFRKYDTFIWLREPTKGPDALPAKPLSRLRSLSSL